MTDKNIGIKFLADYISMESVPSSWTRLFDEINAAYKPLWLKDFDFDFMLSHYGFDETFKKRFMKELSLLRRDYSLNFICFMMHYILFYTKEEDRQDIWKWKSHKNSFKEHGSFMLCAVASLCGYKIHIENLEKRGFDKEQLEKQKEIIRNICYVDRDDYKIDGVRFRQMIWSASFMKGNLVQLGRLQFQIISQTFKEFQKDFDEDTMFVYIHVPKDVSLDPGKVDASIKESKEYIKKYFPETEGKKVVYYTDSWLISPDIEEYLPENCNIIKFKNRFDVVELEGHTEDFLNFVFEDVLQEIPFKELQEDTRLQRGIKKLLLEGKEPRLGIGLLKETP